MNVLVTAADRRGPTSGKADAAVHETASLAFVDASKRFGTVQALSACTFSVARGRMLGFLGPNGAGKTTAMRAVFGLVELDGGQVHWDGRPIGFAERQRFGYMPEERGLYPRMPLAEQIVFFARLHGLDEESARAATARWLERLDLSERAKTPIDALSHGNQQRAQLAAALVHDPVLLVLDEPFSGLDPVAIRRLAEILRGEAERGAAVLFSSHQLELVEDICEDVAVIDHGRIVAYDDVDRLRARSAHRLIDLRLADCADWTPDLVGVTVVSRDEGLLRLSAGTEVDPHAVLEAAARHGQVASFSYGPPSLADTFLELVTQ